MALPVIVCIIFVLMGVAFLFNAVERVNRSSVAVSDGVLKQNTEVQKYISKLNSVLLLVKTLAFGIMLSTSDVLESVIRLRLVFLCLNLVFTQILLDSVDLLARRFLQAASHTACAACRCLLYSLHSSREHALKRPRLQHICSSDDAVIFTASALRPLNRTHLYFYSISPSRCENHIRSSADSSQHR